MPVNLQKKYGQDYPKDCYLSNELLDRRNPETPDYLELKCLSNIPVFVYGPEKCGGKLNKYINRTGNVFLGEAKTATNNYVMEKAEWDGPVVYGTAINLVNSRRIYGEVYLVDALTILNLDKLNGNQEITKREKRFVWLQEQGMEGKPNVRPALKCWVYIAADEYWEDQRTVEMGYTKYGNEEVFDWKTDIQFEIPDFLKGGDLKNDRIPF